MNIDLATPALLFSTISLLLLAYTNRFLALRCHDYFVAGGFQNLPGQTEHNFIIFEY